MSRRIRYSEQIYNRGTNLIFLQSNKLEQGGDSLQAEIR